MARTKRYDKTKLLTAVENEFEFILKYNIPRELNTREFVYNMLLIVFFEQLSKNKSKPEDVERYYEQIPTEYSFGKVLRLTSPFGAPNLRIKEGHEFTDMLKETYSHYRKLRRKGEGKITSIVLANHKYTGKYTANLHREVKDDERTDKKAGKNLEKTIFG